jgi:hypothetical protein
MTACSGGGSGRIPNGTYVFSGTGPSSSFTFSGSNNVAWDVGGGHVVEGTYAISDGRLVFTIQGERVEFEYSLHGNTLRVLNLSFGSGTLAANGVDYIRR